MPSGIFTRKPFTAEHRLHISQVRSKPKEVRECSGGCGEKREVLITSTWKSCRKCYNQTKNHKPDCDCLICETKRGDLRGENHPSFDHIEIHKVGLDKSKFIKEEDLSKYLSDGWILGMSEDKRHIIKETCPDRSGENNGMFGKNQSDEQRRHQSLFMGGTGTPGEISKYGVEWTDILKESIRKRDNFTCQICGMVEEEHLIVMGESLNVHHIDYNKKNCILINLISLCRQCHTRTNFNRDYWKEILVNKLVEKGVKNGI